MLPPAFQALTASDLADQVEPIKITPAPMGPEEMSKLWAAIQSHYRPSAAYEVSVVLIEARSRRASPLPVLSRGPGDPVTHRDRGVVVNADLLPPLPTLFDAEPPPQQSSARLGETVTVTGVRLTGAGHRGAYRIGCSTPIELTPSARTRPARSSRSRCPTTRPRRPRSWPGTGPLSVRFTPTGETQRARNQRGAAADRGGAGDRRRRGPRPPGGHRHPRRRPAPRHGQLRSRPQVRSSSAPRWCSTRWNNRGAALAMPPIRWCSSFPNTVTAGEHWLRLRVDGADSPLVERSGPAPGSTPRSELRCRA